MYATLLSASEALPAGTLQGMFEYAAGAQDEALLATLARRTDLPETLLGRLDSFKSARVRAAYLSRPDRDEAELLAAVKKEKRVTVLAAIASTEEASPRLLDAIAETASGTRGRSVAVALLENTSTPAAGRKIAVQALLESYGTLGYPQRSVLERAVQSDPALHDLAATTGPLQLLRKLLPSEALSEQAVRRAVGSLVKEPVASWAHLTAQAQQGASGYGHRAHTTWEANRRISIAVTDARTLLQGPHATPELQAEMVSIFEGLVLDPPVRALLDSALGAAGSSEAQRRTQLIRTARACTDPAELEAIVSECVTALESASAQSRTAVSRLSQLGELAGSLAENPLTPETAVLRLVPYLDPQGLRSMLLAHPGSVPLLKSALEGSSYLLHDEDVQRSLLAHPEFHVAAVRSLSEGPVGDRHLTALAGTGLLTGAALHAAAWHALSRGLNLSPSSVQLEVASLVAERLGSVTGRWETFSVLGETFDGTLGELLDVCEMVGEATS